MLVLGHVGVTLGMGWALDLALWKKYGKVIGPEAAPGVNNKSVPSSKHTSKLPRRMAMFSYRVRHMDYRLLILGSILPDLIDKPLGHLLFPDFFNHSGRLFAHSLLFLIILMVAGIMIYRWRKGTGLLVLAAGTAVHQLTDFMWDNPKTALWPFLGWDFEGAETADFWSGIWHSLTATPYGIAEAVMALVVIAFFVAVIRRKRLYALIRYGRW